MEQTTQHTATPFHLPLQVNGSEVTANVWVEDAEGRRVLTVKAGERDADQCAYAAKAINAHDGLVTTLDELRTGLKKVNRLHDVEHLLRTIDAALAAAGAA